MSLGIIAWAWPGITLLAVVILFGVFSLVDGIFTIILSPSYRKDNKHWKWSLAAGIFGTIIGILVLAWPLITGLILLILIAAWAMVMGILNIVNAVRMRKEKEGGWSLVIGIIAVGFAIFMFASPLAGAIALLWVWATFGIVYGALMCIQAYRTRRRLKVEAG